MADFKGVLGLEDKAAAEVHMNLARRLLREKAEQRKGGGAEQRKVRNRQLILGMIPVVHPQCELLKAAPLHSWRTEGLPASTEATQGSKDAG